MWDVLLLFLIPIGGGIPGGVLLAKDKGMSVPLMFFLYFLSDLILACIFEPLMLLGIKYCKNNERFEKIGYAFKLSLLKMFEYYGHAQGHLALVIMAFGVDPMTGRAIAKLAGHGFIVGWMIAITGDMLYFSVILASTLWLKGIVDDGRVVMAVILLGMLGIPPLIRLIKVKVKVKVKEKLKK